MRELVGKACPFSISRGAGTHDVARSAPVKLHKAELAAHALVGAHKNGAKAHVLKGAVFGSPNHLLHGYEASPPVLLNCQILAFDPPGPGS